jgi:RNA polymerase sigma factor (TIGR02999 family)
MTHAVLHSGIPSRFHRRLSSSVVQADARGESGHVPLTPESPGDVSQAQSRANLTNLLKAWSDGDPDALDRLTERVYGELHVMARRFMKGERQEHSLQATALVNEVYIRLVDVGRVEWRQRAQFFAMAATMMRRILVDAARARGARKRGSRPVHVNLEETAILTAAPDRTIVALDEALATFATLAARQAQVVELRYFGGLTEEEIASVLHVSPRTVRRDWEFARAWLARELAPSSGRRP